VQEKAGLLWGISAAARAAPARLGHLLLEERLRADRVSSKCRCNWLQAQENSIDPVPLRVDARQLEAAARGKTGPYVRAHLKLGFDEFDYGFVYKRVRAGADESDPLWTVGRVCLWPNGFFLGEHFEWRVPMDDENMLSSPGRSSACPGKRALRAEKDPGLDQPDQDRTPGAGSPAHVVNQDIVAWVGQGAIADRRRRTSARATAASRCCASSSSAISTRSPTAKTPRA